MEKNVKKCYVIAGLTILFWIASLIVDFIVNDRRSLSEQAQSEVEESWSSVQTIVGPIICVPVYYNGSDMPSTCMYVLPENYEVDADVKSDIIRRGFFDVSVYTSKISSNGSYNLKDMKMEDDIMQGNKQKHVRYGWNEVQVMTSIGNRRGLEKGMDFVIDGQKTELNKSFYNYDNRAIKSIFQYHDNVCKIVDLSQMVGKEVKFSLLTNLKGSDKLNIAPIGQNSKITIHGNCPDPSFNGMLLPSAREIVDDGFTATWEVNSMNRDDVEQVFSSNCGDHISFQTVGTKLLVAGGQYTMTDRALKYAFLVILLSLVTIFIAEMSVKSEISVLNYLLIGSALVLFYLMLLSFGEWVGFTLAYVLSALLIIGMITVYLKAIVKNSKVALAVCLFMTLIDVFIYILLGIEEMALLVGTLALFVILGVAMFFSLRLKSTTVVK